MSKWIEEKVGGEIYQILEGHGTQFVVRFVSYSQPQCWRIKESPFLLDVHKSFVNLSEAKEYCQRRYQELFGQRDELTRLRAELAAVTEERDRVREALLDTTASLVASVSLLERGGKKAAPSDTMFAQMLGDYKNSIDRARAAIEGVTEKSGAGNE